MRDIETCKDLAFKREGRWERNQERKGRPRSLFPNPKSTIFVYKCQLGSSIFSIVILSRALLSWQSTQKGIRKGKNKAENPHNLPKTQPPSLSPLTYEEEDPERRNRTTDSEEHPFEKDSLKTLFFCPATKLDCPDILQEFVIHFSNSPCPSSSSLRFGL